MNVYDFDETIFFGDAENRFFAYMFEQKGFGRYRLMYRWNELLFKLKLRSKTKSRENEYSILKKVPDIDALLEDFWNRNEQYMKPWYAKVRRDDDIIATGTPGFLMEPMMKRLGIRYMVSTAMDKHTGKIDGIFAIGEEKAKVFRRQFPDAEIDAFYSDAWSDHFMAELAKKAYIVKGDGELTEWDRYFAEHPKR